MSKNMAPRYYGYERYYNNGYASVVKCSSCGCTALYEDMHPVSPCFTCGGKVEELKESAKWHGASGKWVFAGEEYPQEEARLGVTFTGEYLVLSFAFIAGILVGVLIF